MARSILAFFPLILTAGAILLLLFVILAGITDSVPFNKTWFVSADLSRITGSGVNSPSGYGQWTLWQLCGATTDGANVNCGAAKPAFPYDPSSNFGANAVPSSIADHSSFYYYMSRFSFAFYLITLFFAVCALFTGILALCSRLGSAISSFFSAVALFFAAATAALVTAYVVIGRNQWRDAGVNASVGTRALGFTWGAFAALFLAFFGYCCVACIPRKNKNKDHDNKDYEATGYDHTNNTDINDHEQPYSRPIEREPVVVRESIVPNGNLNNVNGTEHTTHHITPTNNEDSGMAAYQSRELVNENADTLGDGTAIKTGRFWRKERGAFDPEPGTTNGSY